MRDELQETGGFIPVTKGNVNPLYGQIITQTLGPFHETNTCSMKVFVETESRRIVDAGQSVQIEMIEGNAPSVFVEDGKGRAGDGSCFGNADPTCHSAGKPGFPATKLSGQGNECPG